MADAIEAEYTYFEKNSAEDLPPEIWARIFSQIPPVDAKAVNLSCCLFHQISLPLLWTAPRLKPGSVDMHTLEQFARHKLPIRTLEISRFKLQITKSIRELVACLSHQFELKSLNLDRCYMADSTCHRLTFEQLQALFQLPIGRIDTFCLDMHYFNQQLDFMLSLERTQRPSISVHGLHHNLMTLALWEKLCQLPVVEIDGCFCHIRFDLSAYDDLISRIEKPPRYTLRHMEHMDMFVFSPDDLQKLKQTRITELEVGLLNIKDWDGLPVADFVEVLQSNRQQPTLSMGWVDCADQEEFQGLPVSEFQLLTQYPISVLDTSFLRVNADNAIEFVQVILDSYHKAPISRLIIDQRSPFKEEHLALMQLAGIQYEVGEFDYDTAFHTW